MTTRIVTGWRRWLGALAVAATLGCGSDPFDPAAVSLTGRWTGTVGSLGIGFITLDLVESNKEVTGTGTYTSTTGSGQRSLNAHGLHLSDNLQISLDLLEPGGTETLVLPGTIEGANSFHLLFPTEPPLRVVFRR